MSYAGTQPDPAALLRRLDRDIAEFQEFRAQLQRVLGPAASGRASDDAERIKVVDNGCARKVTREEAEGLWAKHQADLVFDVRKSALKYMPRGKVRTRKGKVWHVPPVLHYVLKFALSNPSTPLGDASVSRLLPGEHSISQAALRKQICMLTKRIQGGGTDGPYLFHTTWASADVSSTGWAYFFEEPDDFSYLVIGA